MADFTGIGATSSYMGASQAQAERLLEKARASRPGNSSEGIEKSAKEFEALLLHQWLQEAENTFACVPGGDEQNQDADPGADQFQGLAMQSLATSLTNAGGIGIAKMIARQLHKAEGSPTLEGTAPDTGGMFFREMPK